jgi:hypothetical protein
MDDSGRFTFTAFSDAARQPEVVAIGSPMPAPLVGRIRARADAARMSIHIG